MSPKGHHAILLFLNLLLKRIPMAIATDDKILSFNRYATAIKDRKDILTVMYPKLAEIFGTNQISISMGESREECLPVTGNVGSDVLSAHLQYAEKNIGTITVQAPTSNFFTATHKKIMAAIKDHIAIVIANVLLREEETLLLSLSNDIAAAKNRTDLIDVLWLKLKKLLPIKGFAITLANEDGKTHSPFFVESLDESYLDISNEKLLDQKFNMEDGIFNRIWATSEPLLIIVEDLVKANEAPDYVNFWKEKGIAKVVGIALHTGKKNFGCLIFHLTDQWSEIINPELLKSISAQVSIAISNISSFEALAKKENERELLLTINSYIAAARNTEDLMAIISSHLKQLLSFSHTGITILNADKKTARIFLADPGSISRDHPAYTQVLNTDFPVNDGVMNKVMLTPGPTLLNLQQLKSEQQLPLYLAMNLESGIRQVVAVPFSEAGEVFGFFVIFFKELINPDRTSMNLINGLANQISIAVSNIIANEKIKNEEAEKSKLLEFSNALAEVVDRQQLSTRLSSELKKFDIHGYTIRRILPDKKHHQTFLYDQNAEFAQHPGYKRLLGMEFPIEDGIMNVALASEQPVTFDWNEINTRKSVPEYARWWHGMGATEVTCVPVRIGEENLGVLFLKFPSEYNKVSKYPLLKAICSQIGIALSNLLAKEKILAQLTEINNYKEQLEKENIYLQEEIESYNNYTEIIGESKEVKKVFRMITQVAKSDSTVLLLGETGTGKELIARAIHNASQRKNKLMVKVNCAALPANLIESELFGHERGSFTGALERRIGKFELANNGTLFLDEIGDMPLDMQVKLLRALQEKEIERVGGKMTIKTDVRIIAATNKDLERAVEEGKFRSDLYYRLNIFPIILPSLRDRREDIPVLVSHFIKRYTKKTGKNIIAITNKALQELVQYNWPGNIRELEHQIERCVLLATGDTIKEIHLPHQKRNQAGLSENDDTIVKTIQQHEKEYILKILKKVNGRIGGIGGAAELLGLPTSTLNSRMKRLGIRKEHFG